MSPYDKIRMLGLSALYASLSLLGLMLSFAAYKIWRSYMEDGSLITVGALSFFAAFMFLSNLHTSVAFWKFFRRNEPLRTNYIPLGIAAVTIYLASVVFTSV